MVADTRFKLTQPLRTMVATVLHPVERVLRVPVDAWNGVGDYAMGLQQRARARARRARDLARQAERAAASSSCRREQPPARLLGLRAALTVRSQPAEVLYERIRPVLAQGRHRPRHDAGRGAGSPVINESACWAR
jgi:rod shape-determining protein MreC